VIVGFGVGLPLFGVIVGEVGLSLLKKGERDAKANWHLVPVVVAGRDLAPGSKLTTGELSYRVMPREMLTSSVVMPESAEHVLNQPLTVPVRDGDPLQWSFFLTGVPPREGIEGVEIANGCTDAARRSRRFAPSHESLDAEIRGRLAGSR